jgi:hypothetical protein
MQAQMPILHTPAHSVRFKSPELHVEPLALALALMVVVAVVAVAVVVGGVAKERRIRS